MRKMIRPNNILHQRNQEINTATRKIGINLGNSIVLQNNIKIKQNNILVAIEPVRNEETEESQTVIVPDTQETEIKEINNQMANTQITFCFTDRVQLAPIKQTITYPQSHKRI